MKPPLGARRVMRFIFAGGLDRPVIFASSIFLSLLLRTRTRLGDFGQEIISLRVVVRVSTEMLGGRVIRFTNRGCAGCEDIKVFELYRPNGTPIRDGRSDLPAKPAMRRPRTRPRPSKNPVLRIEGRHPNAPHQQAT